MDLLPVLVPILIISCQEPFRNIDPGSCKGDSQATTLKTNLKSKL